VKIRALITTLVIIFNTQFAFAFTDIAEGNNYFISTQYLRDQNIINGYEDGSFGYWQNINRAEFIKMATIAFDLVDPDDLPVLEDRPFADVPQDSWFGPYTYAAREAEIINSDPNENFYPERTINLAEAIKIVMNLKKSAEETIEVDEAWLVNDTPLEEWFTRFTSQAAKQGIINIYSSNTVNPAQEMTRGYSAEIIYRALLSKENYLFGKATFYGKALQGNSTASGETFDYNLPTAAHKTLPFGTMVEVTNLANGKSIIVKINDRGPYGPGRVIDLSRSAFEQIASLGTGVIYVNLKIVDEQTN
jgi:rare lipoprotein A